MAELTYHRLRDVVDVSDFVANGSFESLRNNVTTSTTPGFAVLVRLVDYNAGWTGPFSYVDESSYKFLKKSRLIPGDVIISNVGANAGTVFRVPDLGMPTTLGPNAVVCRPIDPDVLRQDFFYYLMSSPVGQDLLESIISGSAQPKFNKTALRQIRLSIPSSAEQRAIAEVLGALDDKIAANTKLTEMLTHSLSASYQKVVGSPEELVPFSDLVTVTKGVSYKSVDLTESSTALVTLKSFDRNGGYSARGLKEYSGPHKPQQVIRPGDLVVAQTDLTQAAEVVGRAVRVPASSRHSTLVASLDLAIVRPAGDEPEEFLLGTMLQGRFRTHCQSLTSGTTVLHLKSDAIQSFMAPLVSREIQLRYAALARPMLHLGDSITAENETLAATRDALLPQLMSGKLRVKDIENTMGEMV
ncbi:restriction endonuclease subunit S [Arthrobacter zhaoxinii]|uniref:Restriction endonuclease subunit S n=1 Tax=Arthrobacter zhaoxinii TaxID=2964616 RepID=A0ABY5YSY3_9MICC|nr:restriction endonuclease subunit S [Arthrobacter zhaoxinii]UWX96795.1 restriction endonuclease subunit S [Arthrobacter zhaoxinii]